MAKLLVVGILRRAPKPWCDRWLLRIWTPEADGLAAWLEQAPRHLWLAMRGWWLDRG